MQDPRLAAPLRIVTAAALFDGHDAAINLVRRLLEDQGAEIVHLGHNQAVSDIVRAAVQEDADAIAVSSYQGGHLEFFRYLLAELRARGAGDVQLFGGGGATITAAEAAMLEAEGVGRIYTPEDGRHLGLDGMAADLLARVRNARRPRALDLPGPDSLVGETILARRLSAIECGAAQPDQWPGATTNAAPVLGVTGPGGAGKSTLIDELILRYLQAFPSARVAVLANDPTRQRSGGALLADRLRMHSPASGRVFVRSLATRRAHLATAAALPVCLAFLRHAGFDLIVVETAGSGQSDTGIVDLADVCLYVMTGDFGSPLQLEKIQMLDYADAVALNKSDHRGAVDALREVRRQWQRSRVLPAGTDDEWPVYATMAHQPRDPGIGRLFAALCRRLSALPGQDRERRAPADERAPSQTAVSPIVPPARQRYLAEISAAAHAEDDRIEREALAAGRAQAYHESLRALGDPALPEPLQPFAAPGISDDAVHARLEAAYQRALGDIGPDGLEALRRWPEIRAAYQDERIRYRAGDRQIETVTHRESPSHLRIARIALPTATSWAEQLRFLRRENLPGHYPYTAGVYPFRREAEEPTRMFAGEGTPERTNRRFHYLTRDQPAARLSTAFDPVTLYGEDPSSRPDIAGRIGMSGVSVATLDDVKKLYSGFALVAPTTSVSMTINGPAAVALAWFLNTAVDQEVERHLRATGGWTQAERTIGEICRDRMRPRYAGERPAGHDGLGLGLLGVSGVRLLDPDTWRRLHDDVLHRVRGTIQADILKEDQAQNECLFPVEFGLQLMGDMEQYLIAHRADNYYGVSVSGYHIAEAGANPVTQLAFTLANAFTYVEYYLARGMRVDDFAPHFSFFFSNGMDPEYAVIGRVARRIWARALRHRYGASSRAQLLKYHIQTSGRSLQARDIGFNDIRTTLQALYAIHDNCNSLHTNAYDEAVTTPTEESVRRALAIQLIIQREFGQNYNENPLQGSFLIEQLTSLVEAAVYAEFERLSERGGVLGAMESLYQRARIQQESLEYERRRHDGSLPVVGVNTFVSPATGSPPEECLTRPTDEERRAQIEATALFRRNHADEAPAALARLADTVRSGGNVFGELMQTVRSCTLGEITHALYEVAGRYRRRM